MKFQADISCFGNYRKSLMEPTVDLSIKLLCDFPEPDHWNKKYALWCRAKHVHYLMIDSLFDTTHAIINLLSQQINEVNFALQFVLFPGQHATAFKNQNKIEK
jgi:hypothetical protein